MLFRCPLRPARERPWTFADAPWHLSLVPGQKVIDLKADVSKAQAALNEFLRINASHRVNTAMGMGGSGGITRASGGFVNGAGSDIEDRVPASLSPGEYVLDAQAVCQIGVGRLDQLNEGRAPRTSAAQSAPSPAGLAIIGTLDLGNGLAGMLRGVVKSELSATGARARYAGRA